MQIVAVGGAPVLEVVHECFDEQCLARECLRIVIAYIPEKAFTEVYKAVISVRDLDAHLLSHKTVYPILRIFHQAQKGYQSFYGDGGLELQRVIRNDRNSVLQQVCGQVSSFRVASDQNGDISVAGSVMDC